MTVFSAASLRSPRTRTRSHIVPIVLGGAAAVGAVALVAYLLWPTWGTRGANAPDKLPVSVGGTLFNAKTFRIEPPATLTHDQMDQIVERVERVLVATREKHLKGELAALH